MRCIRLELTDDSGFILQRRETMYYTVEEEAQALLDYTQISKYIDDLPSIEQIKKRMEWDKNVIEIFSAQCVKQGEITRDILSLRMP